MSIIKDHQIDLIVDANIPLIIAGAPLCDREGVLEKISTRLKVHRTDLVIYDSSEGVEKLREALKLLNISPGSQFKVLSLMDGDNLNDEQANTLLKTLEEPPSYAKILLFVSSVSRILPTIRSRCQKIYLSSREADKEGEIIKYFEEGDFIGFTQYLKTIENDEAKLLYKNLLDELKKKGLNKDTDELYSKIAKNLIKINCTNVNPKLLLESIFVWWKAKKS